MPKLQRNNVSSIFSLHTSQCISLSLSLCFQGDSWEDCTDIESKFANSTPIHLLSRSESQGEIGTNSSSKKLRDIIQADLLRRMNGV